MSLEDSLHGLLGRYMGAPQWLRTGAGTIYRSIPPRLKYGARFDSFLIDAERDQSVALHEVERRLAATLEIALSTVPAYRAYRHLLSDSRNAFERLRELPMTSKSDIKANLASYLSTLLPERARLSMFTGGSTTQPMSFFLEKSSSRPRESAYSVVIDRRLLNAKPGEWILSLRGRTVATAVNGQLWMTEPIKRHLILSSDHLEQRYMPQYVDVLKRTRPRVIHAFPSALYPLARWFAENPCPEVTRNVAGILLTSENVYELQSELFERVFGCPVIRHYGHSERVLLAHSVADDSRYHFRPLYGYAERMDADGRSIETPGIAGESVGTSVDNRVMPFIRYRTGDVGVWASAPRSAGSGAAVMQRIEGRLQEFVVCSDRRLVSVTTLGAAHFSELAGVEAIQFAQSQPGHVTLRFVAPRALTSTQAAGIRSAIRSKTQNGCDVSLEHVERIERTPRGKLRMLEQHLDLSEYFGASITPEQEGELMRS